MIVFSIITKYTCLRPGKPDIESTELGPFVEMLCKELNGTFMVDYTALLPSPQAVAPAIPEPTPVSPEPIEARPSTEPVATPSPSPEPVATPAPPDPSTLALAQSSMKTRTWQVLDKAPNRRTPQLGYVHLGGVDLFPLGNGPIQIPFRNEYSTLSAFCRNDGKSYVVPHHTNFMVASDGTEVAFKTAQRKRVATTDDGRSIMLCDGPYGVVVSHAAPNSDYLTVYSANTPPELYEDLTPYLWGPKWVSGFRYLCRVAERIEIRWASAKGDSSWVLNLPAGIPQDGVDWMAPHGELIVVQYRADGGGPGQGVWAFEVDDDGILTWSRNIRESHHHADLGWVDGVPVLWSIEHNPPENNNFPAIVALGLNDGSRRYVASIPWDAFEHCSARGPDGWLLVSGSGTRTVPAGTEPTLADCIWAVHVSGKVVPIALHGCTGTSYWERPMATWSPWGDILWGTSETSGFLAQLDPLGETFNASNLMRAFT